MSYLKHHAGAAAWSHRASGIVSVCSTFLTWSVPTWLASDISPRCCTHRAPVRMLLSACQARSNEGIHAVTISPCPAGYLACWSIFKGKPKGHAGAGTQSKPEVLLVRQEDSGLFGHAQLCLMSTCCSTIVCCHNWVCGTIIYSTGSICIAGHGTDSCARRVVVAANNVASEEIQLQKKCTS